MKALSGGHTCKQIAIDLNISLGTGRSYEKLHVHSHAEAVVKCVGK